MKPFMLRTVLIVLLILTGGYLNAVFAIDENYGAPQLKGNQIRKDSFSVVADTVYFDPALKPLQTTHSVRNLITFRIDEASMKKLPDVFGVTLEIKVYYRKQSGSNTVLDSTGILYLRVDYNKNSTYNYRAIQTFTGGYEAKVEIKKVTPDAGTNLAAIEDVLILENEIFVNREYIFSCTANAIQTISFNSGELSTTGELTINWGKDRAADEYDLEWTYIDDSSLADYKLNPTTYNANAIFLRNATRVSITPNQYRVPMLYDMKGILFFRVRAVQVKPSGQRIEANWSSDYANGLGQFAFDGHDRDFNWQASTSFAEEGKRKSVVQYFDGSLRSRQTVTKDNTTNRTIIAESFYDFQGRPVIQVLPSPSLDSMIRFTPRFNASINSAEYEKELYDKEFSLTDNCEMGAPPFDSASGAAQYYSGSNPLINAGMNQFIPKAKGYPFTEVRYLPDNTNRVSLQSGVGDVFQIGQHATRYYYGSADQEELDALFGTEVGNSSHYFKNMVRDANGQYSVSYVDMLGRTIATALAGDAPDNMEKLASNQEVRVVKKLLDENNNIVKGTTIESSRSLLVPKEQLYTFRYSLIPDSLTILDCQSLPVCYDCRYDLEITITDECGSEPIVFRRDNVSLETNCNAIEAFPAFEETINLKEGNYLVTKKLTLNKSAMDYYRSVFLSRNTCKTKETFLEEQRAALSSMICEPDSVSCRVRLQDSTAYFNNYYSALGIPVAEQPVYEASARAAYQRELRACAALGDRLNNSVRVREAMLVDVTPPFGQYARPEDVDQYSIFYQDNIGAPYRYQEASLIYKDEKGVTDAANGLSKVDFVNNLKPTWTETLLQLHPEYAKLLMYEYIDRLSNGWEEKFQNTNTWQEALAKGYLNPSNFSGLPASATFAHNTAFADPIFTSIAPLYKNAFKAKLDWKAGPESLKLNVWSLATVMAHCKEEDTACLHAFSPINQAFNLGPDCSGELDFAWRYFREFYLQARREMIQVIVSQAGGNIPPVGSKYIVHFNLTPPIGTVVEYPGSKEEAEIMFNAQIDSNCRALSVQWIEDLKPCNLTPTQRDEIISRMIQVCKEGGDPQHVFGASTVKPSSTNLDRSFEQVMKDVLGANYNSNCNVYLINSPKPYGKQPVIGEKEIYSKPDSCECATINSLYQSYESRGNNGENFSQYLYRTQKTTISEGALDTLKRSCNGQLICSFFTAPIKLPPVLQCGVTDVCVDCDAVLTNFEKFKLEFPGVVPSISDTSETEQSNNKLFMKYMNDGLGFNKSTLEYLEFINECVAAGKSCESLAKIRRDYNFITDYDSTHFVGYPDTNTPYKLREVYYRSWAHIPDVHVNTSGWGRRYGKLDTLCLGNEFTIETRIRRPARDTFNSIVDLNISFNQDGHLQQLAPIFYMLKKNPTNADSAFVRANSGRIAYVAAGDTSGQVAQVIPDFTDWKVIKITHSADNYWRLYYNNVLVGERYLDSSVRKLLGISVGFEGKANNGYVEYFKIYDGNNVLRYVEEFEDHIQSNTNAPLAFRCEEKCMSGFAKHFNKQMATTLSYYQIDSLYQSRGCTLLAPCGDSAVNKLIDIQSEFKNDYYNYGIKRDVDGNMTNWWRASPVPYATRDLVRNGVLQVPDTLNTPPLARGVGYSIYKDSICLGDKFAMEMKMKLQEAAGFSYHIYFRGGDYVEKLYIEMNNSLNYCWIDYLAGPVNDPPVSLGGASDVAEFLNLNMSEWTTVKWEFENQLVRFYLNGVLRRTFTFSPQANFKTLHGWNVGGGSFNKVMPLAIDWVKYYDARDSVFYQEDFDDPKNFKRVPDSVHCMRKPCDQDFVAYYNRIQKTNLSYSQIAQVYAQNNVLLDICDSDLRLCGRNEPSFQELTPVQRTPCDDSTMFAFSAATILHDFYKDSVVSSFDDRYLAKCLEVKNTEQFTVEHNVNEYHYTLYYYDLAGNLVKTVPPAGVDISKFAWAASWSDSVKLARKNKTLLTPVHKLPTDYRYNTLNQVVEQKSPDGGRSEFYYDRLGRLALSQNAKQRNDVTPGYEDWSYSYTRYDKLGRITSVGEVKNPQDQETITREMVRDESMLDLWHLTLMSRRSQITSTLYDIPYEGTGGEDFGEIIQKNLRNRVSATFYSDGANQSLYNSATFYTYDIHGNVDKLLQDYGLSGFVPNVMNTNGNRFKLMEYDYDLISGKVNSVAYQRGWADQFYHRYKYDAENRLTLVETSIDGFVWQKDARYEYYLHGPLARTVLGDQSVQGIDYAYTLQGWLKGVNSTGATREHDMGGDGKINSINKYTARDAYGFNLNYFTGDYQPSSVNVNPFPGYSAMLGTRYRPLYNGNISSMATAIRRFEDRGTYENGPNLFFNYKYDQLNRIVSLDTDTGFNMVSNSYPMLNSLPGFKERFSYDANGNILSLRRNNKGAVPVMDVLNYSYYPGTNQLKHVADSVPANNWGSQSWDPIVDIDNQVYTNNYEYDAIGNLKRDSSEGIYDIKWNVYGKIQEINKYPTARSATTRIRYTYDASGNRISKVVEEGTSKKVYTWYVRDAQGNVMSVYKSEGTAVNLGALSLDQIERYMYGSSRLGVERKSQNVDGGPWNAAAYYSNGLFERGRRQYELTNHLGNVLTTITDKKFGVSSNGTLIDYFEPEMISGMDYYAFGSPMRVAGEGAYRFGFNGKENDNEVKGGEGLQQDYGMRVYDSRVGRFLSFDPLSKEYADLSPYHFAGNNPIQNLDKDGGEPLDYRSNWIPVAFRVNDGKPRFSREINDPKLGYISVEAYYDKWSKQNWFVHSGNDGRDYYWKHNLGADQSVRMAGNGQWVEFKTQDKIFLEQTAQLTRGMATGFAAAMAAPFVAYGGISAAGAGLAAIESAAFSALANTAVANATLASIARVPAIAEVGRKVLSALDESGALGGANAAAVSKIESFSAGQIKKFITTEPGALFQVDKMKETIKRGGQELAWLLKDPIEAVMHNGKTFILDGHNRLKALSEMGKDVKVTVLPLEEAARKYKDKVADIVKDVFNTTLENDK
ncbi:RHS repeat-associated core domain-containing protein [Pseudoflavitalea rhizosphaerae]|uniref:RHS repeat-associated core domain-containing protein n=1 Tax=Pseudoflavitalea rhizosphaerae TaxID=1884793 RepID=UPI000F8E0FA2|nr:RHS repeat-associated core domain-containing protein [Pseudoflavitalea rhizosphaerae]